MQIEISRGRDPQIEPSYRADGQTDAAVISIREKFVEMAKFSQHYSHRWRSCVSQIHTLIVYWKQIECHLDDRKAMMVRHPFHATYLGPGKHGMLDLVVLYPPTCVHLSSWNLAAMQRKMQ